MKLVCTAPSYSIKGPIFYFLVSWNKVIDLDTKEIVYRAEGKINRFLARLIYKKDIYLEKEISNG